MHTLVGVNPKSHSKIPCGIFVNPALRAGYFAPAGDESRILNTIQLHIKKNPNKD